jgi:hypothetical protein
MLIRLFTLAFVLVFFLSSVCVHDAFGAEQAVFSNEVKQLLIKNYPNHKVVNSCSGAFVGKPSDAVAVLRNEAKKEILVLWVMSNGNIQQLDSVTAVPDVEPKCWDAKEAKRREYDLHHTESIEAWLKVRTGLGALCYFTDNTTAKCWSLDRASGRLTEIGGWMT